MVSIQHSIGSLFTPVTGTGSITQRQIALRSHFSPVSPYFNRLIPAPEAPGADNFCASGHFIVFSPAALRSAISDASLVISCHDFAASTVMLWFVPSVPIHSTFFPPITLCGFSEMLRGSAVSCIYAIHLL